MSRQQSYHAEAPWPGYEVERPMARPTVEGHVVVPFCQAMIIGGTVGLLATWGLVELEVVRHWWPAGGLLMLAAFGLAFLVKVSSAEATLWTVERVIGADLDRDGTVGKPEDHDHIILAGPGPTTLTPAERKRGQFVTFVRAIGATGDTSRERFEGSLGRQRYEEFRNALIGSGLAQWVDPDNHRQGWELARDPAAIIQGVM